MTLFWSRAFPSIEMANRTSDTNSEQFSLVKVTDEREQISFFRCRPPFAVDFDAVH